MWLAHHTHTTTLWRNPSNIPSLLPNNRCLWSIFMSCALLSQGTKSMPSNRSSATLWRSSCLPNPSYQETSAMHQPHARELTDWPKTPLLSALADSLLRRVCLSSVNSDSTQWKYYTQSRAGSALAEITLRLTKSQFINSWLSFSICTWE